jgi:hypothetical protein
LVRPPVAHSDGDADSSGHPGPLSPFVVHAGLHHPGRRVRPRAGAAVM